MFEKREGREREGRERIGRTDPIKVLVPKPVVPIVPKRPILSPVLPPVKKVPIDKPVVGPRLPWTIYQKPYVPDYSWLKTSKPSVGDDADEAKKLARIAAIKKAALNNKKSNVATSTAADAEASPALSSLLTGGGGYGSGYLADSGGNGGFSFSDVPSIVWIILAVGAGYWLMKSGGKGKLF